jgi:predicted nucleotidyltransferase
MLNKDYKEMLQILLDNKVRFLVVGAYAMGAYGYPRATGDFDIWVEASSENSEKIYRSLSQFGAPLSDISKTTFCEEGIIFQIGVAPRRIDIITKIDGVDFKKAYSDKQEVEIEDIKIPFISKEDLIKNKESTGREKDILDVKYLRGNHDA